MGFTTQCQSLSVSDEAAFPEYLLRQTFLFFSIVLWFWENSVSPCLSAPSVTPSPTKMLVTPILETCLNTKIINHIKQTRCKSSRKHGQKKVVLFLLTDLMFLSSSSKKSMSVNGTPVLVCIFWKCSVLWVQLENISLATNKDLIFNLSMKVLAISEVGDLEAIAIWIPFSFRPLIIPFACGYKDGISRLERHSLCVRETKQNKTNFVILIRQNPTQNLTIRD